MPDEQSVQILSFKFGATAFSYRRIAQNLNKSLSAINSFVRDYLDLVLKADRCAQYVDDKRIAVNTSKEVFENIEVVFQRIELEALKLLLKKCTFGYHKTDFLEKRIRKQKLAPSSRQNPQIFT